MTVRLLACLLAQTHTHTHTKGRKESQLLVGFDARGSSVGEAYRAGVIKGIAAPPLTEGLMEARRR